MITEKKVQVYSLLLNMIIKLIFAIVMLVILITVTVKLILHPDWPLAATELGTSGIMTIVFRHYFPRQDTSGE